MTAERVVFAVAGFFIMLSLALGAPFSPFAYSENWLYFTAFVGANLFQSAFTNFCPLTIILNRFGVKSACSA